MPGSPRTSLFGPETGGAGAAAAGDAGALPRGARRSRARRAPRIVLRWLLLLAAAAVVLAAALLLWGWSELRGSRPRLTGEAALPGLSAPVTVARDSLGVPDVRAAGWLDAARALGFLHAQERFFQMDLQRRRPAGELSALAGRMTLRLDRDLRRHQFRRRAEAALARCAPRQRELLDAYAAGVNAGLRALRRPPFEYRLLRARPAPWRAEDSFLVLFSMFDLLSAENESSLRTLFAALPRPLAEFLAPQGTEWDAPLLGGPLPEPPLPGPETLDLRRGWPGRAPAETARGAPPVTAARSARDVSAPPPAVPPSPRAAAEPFRRGSNNWALAGWRARHGGALLANDMHLGHDVPNIWYRACLSWPGRRLVGVTLPGVPGVVAGSNGEVAWGFTNSYSDFIDLVVVEPDPADTSRYLAPGGPLPFGRERETIAVHGGAPDTLEIVTTVWGPLWRRDHLGRPLALRWSAHDTAAVNLRLLDLADVRTVDDALALAPLCGIPPQNLVCADRDGRIGWTIAGRLPRRAGWDGRLPVSWADGRCRWEGWVSPQEMPRVVDPPDGQVWTANARVVDAANLAVLGDGGYGLGARARQIRDGLSALGPADERAMLDLQLDDRALFLERWRALLLDLLSPQAVAAAPLRAELRALVDSTWTGRASPASAGYRLVRGFRGWTRLLVLGWLTEPCRAADPAFDLGQLTQWEGPVWRLVTERPAHLLDPRFASWEAALLAAADSTTAELTRSGRPLASRTWGERNTLRMRHPLSASVGAAAPALAARIARWLDMPAQALPGDAQMPRVQSPREGASERLVVSPGREEQGLFHMPGGQSGHPLSPYYRRGHRAWVEGAPTPLLPGATVWSLRLRPGE